MTVLIFQNGINNNTITYFMFELCVFNNKFSISNWNMDDNFSFITNIQYVKQYMN